MKRGIIRTQKGYLGQSEKIRTVGIFGDF